MATAAVALQQENQVLRAQLEQKDDQLEQKDLRIHQLEELIKQFQHREFGPSSEQTPPRTAWLAELAAALRR